jgi:hypothetical protein
MFCPLQAIIRTHSKYYTGITFHMILLNIGCYCGIAKELKIVTESVSTVSLFNYQPLYIDY